MTYGGGSLYISDNTPTGTPTVIFKPVSTPTAGSKAVVTSGNLYDALNSSTLTAKILDSVNRSSEVSTVTPNYYTPTSISQGMTLDILNGKVPLFGTSNDNAYKGFINVRFLQGGAGKSEYYGGTPTLQIAVWKNTLYFRTAEVTSGKSWESWQLLQGKPIVKTVTTMVDMEVYPNVYYYCEDAIDELSIADTYDSRGIMLSNDFGVGVDGAVCEYIFDFVAGSGFTLSFPSNVLWNSIPSFTEGKRYLISVVNGLAVWSEFSSES